MRKPLVPIPFGIAANGPRDTMLVGEAKRLARLQVKRRKQRQALAATETDIKACRRVLRALMNDAGPVKGSNDEL